MVDSEGATKGRPTGVRRKRVNGALTALMLMTLLASVSGADSSAPGRGSLVVVLRDARSGSPLVGASVKIKGDLRARSADSSGTVVFQGLKIGEHIVQAYLGVPMRMKSAPRGRCWSMNYDARRGRRASVTGNGPDTLIIRIKGKEYLGRYQVDY